MMKTAYWIWHLRATENIHRAVAVEGAGQEPMGVGRKWRKQIKPSLSRTLGVSRRNSGWQLKKCTFFFFFKLRKTWACLQAEGEELKKKRRLKGQERKETADGSRSWRRWEGMKAQARVAGLGVWNLSFWNREKRLSYSICRYLFRSGGKGRKFRVFMHDIAFMK